MADKLNAVNFLTCTAASPVDVCPFCKGAGHRYLTVTDQASEKQYSASRCVSCGAIFYDNPDEIGGRYFDLNDESLIVFYADNGAGYDRMIECIQSYWQADKFRSYADVGCGTGFGVHFAKHILGAAAVGFEPSQYGTWGARNFNIDVRQDYLTAWEEGRPQYDFIFSSEVIEHVPDPEAFVQVLGSNLSADGVAVLTTPNADFVTPENDSAEVYSALFPGEHRFLFTRVSLTDLLQRCGFSYIDLSLSTDKQLVAAFARHAIARNSKSRQPYLDYLDVGTSQYGENRRIPYRGFAYRAFKEAVNLGDTAAADRYLSILQEERQIAHRIAYDSTDATLSALSSIHGLEDYRKVQPFFTGPLLYYMAMYELLKGDKDSARRFLEAAKDILDFESNLASAYFLEARDLLKSCWLNLAMLTSDTKAPQAVIEAFERSLELSHTDPDFERRCLWQYINFINSKGIWDKFVRVFLLFEENIFKHFGSPSLPAICATIKPEDAVTHRLAAIDVFDPFWALLLYQLNALGDSELAKATAREINELVSTPFFTARYGDERRSNGIALVQSVLHPLESDSALADTPPHEEVGTAVTDTEREMHLLHSISLRIIGTARRLRERRAQRTE